MFYVIISKMVLFQINKCIFLSKKHLNHWNSFLLTHVRYYYYSLFYYIKRRICIYLKVKFINDEIAEKNTKVINRFNTVKIVSNKLLPTQKCFFF